MFCFFPLIVAVLPSSPSLTLGYKTTVSSLPALRCRGEMRVNKSWGATESRGEIGFPGAALLPEETSRFDWSYAPCWPPGTWRWNRRTSLPSLPSTLPPHKALHLPPLLSPASLGAPQSFLFRRGLERTGHFPAEMCRGPQRCCFHPPHREHGARAHYPRTGRRSGIFQIWSPDRRVWICWQPPVWMRLKLQELFRLDRSRTILHGPIKKTNFNWYPIFVSWSAFNISSK